MLFLLISLRSLNIYMNINNNDQNILKDIKKLDPNSETRYITTLSWYTLRYIELWNLDKPTIIFIHWTPGSLRDALPLLKKTNIIQNYHIIIPDRPWFGWSHNNREFPNIKEQSEILSELIFLPNNSEKIQLIWRSYAWALLPYISKNHPQKIESMIIIAGTMDPKNQTIWKISYPLHYTWLKYIIPNMLRATNSEKLASIEQLNILSWIWENITIPVWLIHWTKDRIVKIENTYYAEKMLTNSPKIVTKIIDNIGHEIPITQPQIILNVLDELNT